MAGGLVQLVAYGVQDLYLTGDPQITFFKILYRRHTNFSIESVPQNFSAPANFGETVTCTLARAGDLIGKILLYVQIPALPKFINANGDEDNIKKMAWVNNLGYALILEIFIEIGGKLIDKQYGEWMYIWSQLTNKQDHGLNKMVGNVTSMYEFSNGKESYKLFIPLEFWFCRNNGLALPLISLASSEVKITVTFRKLEECYRIGPTHSIEMVEDIVPFRAGDYIQQTINNQTIYGYVIGYDYVQKKLYYIKIVSPSANKKTFESPRESNVLNNQSYRIYNTITKVYANPKPNSREIIEPTALVQKPRFVNAFFYVNYVYLDVEERTKFSRTNHEYLIEQIQFNQEVNVRSPNVKQNITLNHPCKAYYWIAQLDSMVGPNTMNDIFNYTTSPIHYPSSHSLATNLPMPVINEYYGVCPDNNSRLNNMERFYGTDLVQNAKLLLNGRDRFGDRTVDYFNLVEPYEHHYRGPVPGINIYSFSLNPEDHQPSSAANMSEIDHIVMQLRLNSIVGPQNTAKIRSYTINYNILRIFFNMGGLAFI